MDIKSEIKNFKTINLEDIIKDGVRVSDNVRNSVFLYNKAIESFKSGSEDIAIIELKKAISMNPRFYEAMNLMAVCYEYAGDREKAAEMFNKVITAEPNSVLAVKYMQRLGMGETGKIAIDLQPKQQSWQPGEPLKRIRAKKKAVHGLSLKNRNMPGFLFILGSFAAGILLSVLVYTLMPEKIIAEQPPPTESSADDNSAADKLAEYEKMYENLERKYALLQQDKENAVQRADYYKVVIKLYDIDIMYRDKEYEDAADMLFIMKTVDLNEEEQEKFDHLYGAVMPLAAKSAYDEGYKLFNSRKYQEALNKLEKVQIYYPEYAKADAALYYMGRSCQLLQDSRGALALFQKLLESYPKSAYVKSTNARIKELTQIP